MHDVPAGAHLVTWLREFAPAITSTPTAFFDLDRVIEGIGLVRHASPGAMVTYAVKASYLRPLLEVVREAGAGASVFSDMELSLVRRAGFAPGDIIYNGVGRVGRGLQDALRAGVRVNIESLTELRSLLDARGRAAEPGVIGLRVNAARPEVRDDPEKYGVLGLGLEDLPAALDLIGSTNLRVSGLTFHQFANQTDGLRHLAFLDTLIPAIRKLAGHTSIALDHIDVGGGFASRLDIGDARGAAAFQAIANRIEAELGLSTVYELGRFLVADAEAVVSRVLDVRTSPTGRRVAILDVTTNYLIPAPGHRFRVERLAPPASGEVRGEVQFVDRLGSDICRNECAALDPGTFVCVVNAGAYAGVMKERFVYPLPDMRFIRNGRLVAASSAGDEHDVLSHHDWHRLRDCPRTGER